MCEYNCFALPLSYLAFSSVVEAQDAVFFARNPHRTFLVRRAYAAEAEEESSDNFVVVHRALDGKAERRPFVLLDGVPPASESDGRALWQIWDIDELGGEVISWDQVWLVAAVLDRMSPPCGDANIAATVGPQQR